MGCSDPICYHQLVISRIQALNYRSLRWVDMPLEKFEVLVGPNGSGKSTFLDVIGFLSDVMKVGVVKAIYGDQRLGVSQRSADPSQLCWMRRGDSFQLALEAPIPEGLSASVGGKNESTFDTCRYEVEIAIGEESEPVGFRAETLWLSRGGDYSDDRPSDIILPAGAAKLPGWRAVVKKTGTSGNDYFASENSAWKTQFRLGSSKSALASLPEDEERFPVATWFKRELMDGVQRLVLASEAIRRPSPPGLQRGLLPDGSNLPWMVHALPEDLRREWVTHLQTALPDIKDISTIERPEDKHRYLQIEYENGLIVPSWLISDGTLRLMALTLLAYVPELTGTYLIEEPENGIHPRAVETVFEALSQVYGAQVLCATHSPILVGVAEAKRLLCFSRSPTDGTRIIRGSEHARLKEWKGEVYLGTYFASGVLE